MKMADGPIRVVGMYGPMAASKVGRTSSTVADPNRLGWTHMAMPAMPALKCANRIGAVNNEFIPVVRLVLVLNWQ